MASSPDTTHVGPPEQAPRQPAGSEAPTSAPLSPEDSIRQKVLLLIDQAGIAGLAKLPKACANRIAMLAAVQRDPFALLLASDELKDDKEIVLAAVRQNGCLLAVASEELRNDLEVVEAAVKQNSNAIKHIGMKLYFDTKPGALLYIQHAAEAIRGIPKNFVDDKDVALLSVKRYGYDLESCSEGLRDDEDVVLTAIGGEVNAYKYASDRLKASRRIIIAGLMSAINPKNFSKNEKVMADIKSHCPSDLMPLFMLMGGYGGCDFDGLSADIKDDELVLSVAIQHGLHKFYKHASSRLKARRDLALDMVKSDPSGFEYIDEAFKKDRVFLAELARCNFGVLLQNDFINAYRAACA